MNSTDRTSEQPSRASGHFCETPLPQLISELNVKVVELDLQGTGFCGFAAVRQDGQLILAMPTRQPAHIQNSLARQLLQSVLQGRH
ncbi:hypothetical protein [Streptomyces sp. NPDC059009]|uniref:hypothetical protein n=1 Tax=Streptomyces sp. NPDC059009 TaxID=3346694 RepID=UPI0036AAA4B9